MLQIDDDSHGEEIECCCTGAQASLNGSSNPILAHDSYEALTLVSLPPEVILQIFHEAREPNLIHSCRFFYNLPPPCIGHHGQEVPSYICYTQNLTHLAFAPRSWTWTASTIPPFEYCNGINLSINKLCPDQKELQLEVYQSRWLTSSMFLAAHSDIWRHMVQSVWPNGIGWGNSPAGKEHHLARANLTARPNKHHLLCRKTSEVIISGEKHAVGLPRNYVYLSGRRGQKENVQILVRTSIPDCILTDPSKPSSKLAISILAAD